MTIRTVLVTLLACSLPGVLAVQAAEVDSTKRVDKRQATQDKRIDKGMASGQLNKKEAARLEKGQKRVDRAESRAAQDGKVTRKEREQLEAMQDRQSKRIRNQRKDDDRAPK